MKNIICFLIAFVSCALLGATPTISNVTAQQRGRLDGKVDIEVTFNALESELTKIECVFSAMNKITEAEIPVLHIEKVGEDVGSEMTWTRQFVWDARTDIGEVRIDNVLLSVEITNYGGVQLWEDGPYWAECNVGAKKPEENGYYFWWGDTVGYTYDGEKWNAVDGSCEDFQFISNLSNCPTYNKNNSQLEKENYIDSSGNLNAEHDAAVAHRGSPWRMPTCDEIITLMGRNRNHRVRHSWTVKNEVPGWLITGSDAYSTNSIFLPAAGYGYADRIEDQHVRGNYWSSMPASSPLGNATVAIAFSLKYVDDRGNMASTNSARYCGLSVRPVRDANVFLTHLAYDGRTISNPVIMPSSGTVFDTSLTISMSCASERMVIHYTTDGSDPTIDSPVYKRFRVYGKTIVKARAYYEDGLCSEVVAAEYAPGKCPNPIIRSAGGETFYHNGNRIVINYMHKEGELHYTTDGSEVTKDSPIYVEPFMIDETTTVKARAFSDIYFDSDEVSMTLKRDMEVVATPIIDVASIFKGSRTEVAISCKTKGATIYYTIDGSEPTEHSEKYKGSFNVFNSAIIKAYATCYDCLDSKIAAKSVTKQWAIGDSLGLPDLGFTNGGDVGWIDDNGVAMRSGNIGDNNISILSAVFNGKGVLTFQWKVSCEEDIEYHNWDHVEFKVDGELVELKDGETGWMDVCYEMLTEKSHTVEWVYVKDDAEAGGEDCAWVRNIVWKPELTQIGEIKVPLTWLKEKFPDLGDYYYDYEYIANSFAANGCEKIYTCYITGVNPTDPKSRFETKIELLDGEVKISWEPNLNTNGEKRLYRAYGRRYLDKGGWETPIKSYHRFFKVEVKMPNGMKSDVSGERVLIGDVL